MPAATDSTPRLCSFESRRADEMRRLIEKLGGRATVAPSMREIPLGDNVEAFAFGDELLAGRIGLLVFLTGVGARSLFDCLAERHGREAVLDAMRRTEIAVRGPKPTTVLKELDVPIAHRAPSPNTHVELLATLRESVDLTGRTVAVQEYGRPNEELYDGLRDAGAEVLPVPIYRWALPEDTGPLEEAIAATAAGRFDSLLFTSARQVDHVLEVADRVGGRESFLSAARETVVASVGPECSDALRASGLPPDVEASPPKMGPLVRLAVQAATVRADSERPATETPR